MIELFFFGIGIVTGLGVIIGLYCNKKKEESKDVNSVSEKTTQLITSHPRNYTAYRHHDTPSRHRKDNDDSGFTTSMLS